MSTRCQKRCDLDQGRLRDVEVLLQEGVCVCVLFLVHGYIFLSNKQTQIRHSKTDEVPSYFLALAGSIRVHYNSLDVRRGAAVHSFVRFFVHSFLG